MQTLKDFHTQLLAVIALAILVAGFVLAPEERIEHVGHALVVFGATGPGAMIYSALAALVIAVLKWALDRIPKGATTTTTVSVTAPVKVESDRKSTDGSTGFDLLCWLAVVGALVVLGSIHGCGGVSAGTVTGGIAIVEVAKDATCTIASQLCEANDPQCGASACRVFHDVCAVVAPASHVQVTCAAPDVMPPEPAAAAGGAQ